MSTVFSIVTPLVEELSADETDAMDVDDANEAKMTSDLRERTLASAVEAAEGCLRTDLLASKQGVEKLHAFLNLSAKANSSLHARLIATATFDTVKSLSSELSRNVLDELGEQETQVQAQLLALLSLEHYPSAPEAFRLKRAQAVAALAAVPWEEKLATRIRTKLKEDFAEEKSPVVKQILKDEK